MSSIYGIAVRKTNFIRILKKRLFLRFHMSLILIGTALMGLLASKLLLIAHVDNIVVRYPVAVVVSYLVFFGFIKLWLSYVTSSSARESQDACEIVADAITGIPDFSGGSTPATGSFSGGGGGNSGGAGASGSFDVDGHDILPDATAHAGHGMRDAIGDIAGEAASGVADAEEGGCVLVILGILLAIIFGAGLYLLYEAPFILSEAAFDFVLAASLLKSSKKIDDPDWKGSILRTTWKPFLVVLLFSFVGAYILHALYPEVHKLSEFFNR